LPPWVPSLVRGYFEQFRGEVDAAGCALKPLLPRLQQLVVGLGDGDCGVEDLYVLTAVDYCLWVDLNVLQSIVLDVNERAHHLLQKYKQLALTEIPLFLEAVGDYLCEGEGGSFEEDVELVIVGAELLPLHLAEGVHIEDVRILGYLGDPAFELPESVLHEEGISEGKHFEHAVVLVSSHQGQRPQMSLVH
jgi:hypothetical protein